MGDTAGSRQPLGPARPGPDTSPRLWRSQRPGGWPASGEGANLNRPHLPARRPCLHREGESQQEYFYPKAGRSRASLGRHRNPSGGPGASTGLVSALSPPRPPRPAGPSGAGLVLAPVGPLNTEEPTARKPAYGQCMALGMRAGKAQPGNEPGNASASPSCP